MVNIIACPRHRERIETREKDQIVSKLQHFHCHCNVEHKTFVFRRQGHQTIFLIPEDMNEKCFCKGTDL